MDVTDVSLCQAAPHSAVTQQTDGALSEDQNYQTQRWIVIIILQPATSESLTARFPRLNVTFKPIKSFIWGLWLSMWVD